MPLLLDYGLIRTLELTLKISMYYGLSYIKMVIIDITDLNYDKKRNQAEFIQFIPNVESIIVLNIFCETKL